MPCNITIITSAAKADECSKVFTRQLCDEIKRNSYELLQCNSAPAEWASATNRVATGANGRYILLLGSRLTISDGAIDRLIMFANCTPDARIWSGQIVCPRPDRNVPASAANATLRRYRTDLIDTASHWKKTHSSSSRLFWKEPEATVRYVVTAPQDCMLIDARLWHQLGGFNEALNQPDATVDFCRRAAIVGATPLTTPNVKLIAPGQTNSPDDPSTKRGNPTPQISLQKWLHTQVAKLLPANLNTGH